MPQFFYCTDTEPSPRQNQQDLPHYSRPCSLFTDDIAGVLAQPICARLSPFLKKLVFQRNNDMERFTKEQEAALKILTSLQELQISYSSKLQSSPAGLSGLPNLKRFEISYLDSIQSIPMDGLPSSLTELRIESCPAI
jgi:Leucine-rich repeat (LRR) protein